MRYEDGTTACTMCGRTGIPIEKLGAEDLCVERCKPRQEGYNAGSQDALRDMLEATFRTAGEFGLEPVEMLRAARDAGHPRVDGFLAILERGEAEAELAKNDERIEREFLARREEAERFAAGRS